jgi:hypothetical protein
MSESSPHTSPYASPSSVSSKASPKADRVGQIVSDFIREPTWLTMMKDAESQEFLESVNAPTVQAAKAEIPEKEFPCSELSLVDEESTKNFNPAWLQLLKSAILREDELMLPVQPDWVRLLHQEANVPLPSSESASDKFEVTTLAPYSLGSTLASMDVGLP